MRDGEKKVYVHRISRNLGLPEEVVDTLFLFLFPSKVLSSLNGLGKSQHHHWVPPSWTACWSSYPGPSLCAFPSNLPPDSVREPVDDLGYQGQFSPSHAHVLLLESPLLPGSLLFFSHFAQDAKEPPVWEESHLSGGLFDPSFLCACLWRNRALPPCSDGIWPLCCHLLPSTLWSDNEQWAECGTGMGILGSGLFGRSHQYPPSLEFGLLWNSSHLQLHLWDSISVPSLLFQ